MLVPVGVLASHGIGYLMAHPEAAERHQALEHHSHLPLLGVAAIPAAAAALVWAVMAGRHGRRPDLRLLPVVASQSVAFVVLELVEHAAAQTGVGGALAEPGLWCGLLAQVLVAWGAIGLCRVGARIGAALGRRTQLVIAGRPPLAPLPTSRWDQRRPLASPASRRGPPLPAQS